MLSPLGRFDDSDLEHLGCLVVHKDDSPPEKVRGRAGGLEHACVLSALPDVRPLTLPLSTHSVNNTAP